MTPREALAPDVVDVDDPTLIAGLEDELTAGIDTDDDAPAATAVDDADDGEPEEEGEGVEASSEGEEAAPADEPEAEAEPITREDGATWNVAASRWQKDGKFVEGDPPAQPPAQPAASATAAATEPPAAEQPPAWEPLAITVDRASVPIPEAVVSRANGHVILGIKEDQFAEFQRRLVKGVVAERSWRQLNDGVKQLEAEREAARTRPATRSDAEVEADVLMQYLKPHMADLFDETTLKLIDAEVKLAQRAEQDKVRQHETQRAQQTDDASAAERQVLEGMATTIIEIADAPEFAAEFQSLTQDDLRSVLQELQPISRAVFWKDTDGWMRNTQLVYDRLKAKAEAKASTKSSASSTSATSATASPATPPTGGTTANAGTGKDRAERFNQGQATAAQPTTTSVKARRTTPTSRPSATAGHHRPARAAATAHTSQQEAEDAFRRTTRSFLSSDSLDFPDEE